jgi:ornithine--oxo-acid transaminase
MDELKKIHNPKFREVRGKGLLIGIELTEKARPYCEKLMELGILTKETHDMVVRFAPPLIIKKKELEWALDIIKQVFSV